MAQLTTMNYLLIRSASTECQDLRTVQNSWQKEYISLRCSF